MPEDFNQQIIEEFHATGGHASYFPVEPPSALVLVHHKGAKSGTERVNPLVAQLVDDKIAIFASKGGAPDNPDWFHNLKANPETVVELGTDTIEVTARVAEGDERDRIWSEQKTLQPAFAKYEEQTDRVIPVVVLERR